MIQKLQVLTFADQPLSDQNHLRRSCEKLKISLEVLICSPWVQNVIKLKMLYEYVHKADPETVLVVVDAYDVVIYDRSEEILKKFENEGAEVLFSGESNFMYKEPKKWLTFLRRYPKKNTIYQFLNSGSYIGRVKHIKEMLDRMQSQFELDIMNEEKLLPIRSDQYLLSRFYVENYTLSNKMKLKINIDHSIMGCTGGRFCVVNFPDITRWQAFVYFILERNLLKLFKLHKHQKIPKDYISKNGKFLNRKMKTAPPIMHFPGTWDRFDKVYENLLENRKPSKKGSWGFAFVISILSYPISILVGPIIWLTVRK